MPDQDAVIAVTCESPNMQGEINLLWEYLLPAIKTDKMPGNSALLSILKQKLSALALPLPAPGEGSAVISHISGKTFALGPNDHHLETISFGFTDKTCNVTLVINSVRYNFSLGSGQWLNGETTLPGPNLLLLAKAHFASLPPPKVAGSYGWKDEKTLEMVLRYIESPHTETIICRFDDNRVSVNFHYSNEPNINQPELKGIVKE